MNQNRLNATLELALEEIGVLDYTINGKRIRKGQTMCLVMESQYMENYGAHDWDGTGLCPQHWKCKGGTTYILKGITMEEACGDPNVIHAIADRLSECIGADNDEYSTEHANGWELCFESELNLAHWETPMFLTRDGDEFQATQTLCSESAALRFTRDTYALTRDGLRSVSREMAFRDGRVKFIEFGKEAA